MNGGSGGGAAGGAGGDLPVGSGFGDFEIRGRLGAGGMGVVFRAYDRRHGGEVALKVLPAHLTADPVTVERFRREARAAFELRDPHVVPVHSYGEVDGRLYLSMRLIDGEDLARLLARRAPLPPARAAGIVRQAAHALDAAHAAGLVHRDVKPANLLVVEGRDDFVSLVDFGIARAVGPDPDTALTATGATVGTLGYLAPERLADGRGTVDGRADVYSLTCVLVEMLTGRPPFPGSDPASVLSAHLLSAPPTVSTLVAGLDPAWDDVVATGMAKDPEHRYPSAGALAAAAQRVAAGPARAVAPAAGPAAPAVPAAPAATRPETIAPSVSPGPPASSGQHGQHGGWILPDGPATAPAPHGGDRPGRPRRGLGIAIGAALVAAAVLVGVVWAVVPDRGSGTSTVAVPGFATPAPGSGTGGTDGTGAGPLQPAGADPTASGTPQTGGTAETGEPDGGGEPDGTGETGEPAGPVVDPLVGNGDLRLTRPITRLGCTGQDVVVVGAAVDPPRYAADVTMHLDRHPGANYLRALGSCTSFRPRTPSGELIYAIYLGPFDDRAQACAAWRAAGGDSYLQPLGSAPRSPGGTGC